MKAKIKSLVLSALLVAGTVAHAQTQAPTGPANMLQLVAEGEYEAARAMLEALPHSPIDRLFLEAQIFQAQGQIDQAIITYRAILSLAPGIIPVRQALAGLLFQKEDYAGARFHFERLIALDDRADVRQAYARALSEIRRAEPYGISAYLSFTPSTNINRGSSNTEFISGQGIGTIVETGQETSGIGLRAGGAAFVKYPVGENAEWKLTGQGNWTFYSDDRFDFGQGGVVGSYQITQTDSQTEFSAFRFRNFRDLDPGDNDVFGLSVDHRRRAGDKTTMHYTFSIQDTVYDDSAALSGPSATFRIGAQQQIRPDLALLGNVTVSRGRPEGENNRHYGLSAELGVSKNWPSGWSNYVALQVGGRRYDTEFAFGAPEREDDFAILKGSILNSTLVFRGYTPRLDCLVQQNWSNISFFDYQVGECGVVFTREF